LGFELRALSLLGRQLYHYTPALFCFLVIFLVESHVFAWTTVLLFVLPVELR
jgi:hypothetical protein